MKEGTAGFAWDAEKERENIGKHGVDFAAAARAFADPARRIYTDQKHSAREERFFAWAGWTAGCLWCGSPTGPVL
ncbi:MAG: BrnT family toxin [Elusimicrobiales bacterium]